MTFLHDVALLIWYPFYVLCLFFFLLCVFAFFFFFFFFQAEDGIRDAEVTGVQTCALPILRRVFFGRHDRQAADVSTPKPISHLAAYAAGRRHVEASSSSIRWITGSQRWYPATDRGAVGHPICAETTPKILVFVPTGKTR